MNKMSKIFNVILSVLCHPWNQTRDPERHGFRIKYGMTQKGFIKLTKKTLISTFILWFVILASGLIYLFNPFNKTAEAAWFNDSWGYRKRIDVTIASSSSDITSLHTLLTVDTDDFITAGKLQSSCQDLRFTNTNGLLLPYYIDSGCNGNSTKVWVLADLVPKNTTTYTLYMYYGNPGAVAGTDPVTLNSVVNLVGYWTMNDNVSGDAQTLIDSSITAKNGTTIDGANNTGMNCTVSGTSSAYSKACNFDGTDDSVRTASYAFGMSDVNILTFEAWFQTDDITAVRRTIFTSAVSGDAGAWMVETGHAAGQISVIIPGVFVAETAAGVIADTNWHHIVYVRRGSGATHEIWVDGVQKTLSVNTTNTFTDPTAIKAIGERAAGQFWDGTIDDVRVYNSARTAAQIAADYANTACGGACGIVGAGATTIVPTTVFVTEEKTPSPLGYWKFDDAQGTTAQDATTNNNDGTISGATWQTEDQCITGKCLWFDGSNDRVDIGDVLEPTNITLAAWVKPQLASTDQRIISKWGDTSAERQYLLTTDNTNKFRFAVLAGGAADICDSSNTYSTGTWYHVVGTYNGTTCKMYVNGIDATSINQDTGSGDIQGTSTTLRIGIEGDDGTSVPFKGFIDEPKIYSYTRSAAEVKADFNSKSNPEGVATSFGGDAPNNLPGALNNGLVGYWKADESSGNMADSSGNGTTLTDTNTVAFVAGKFGNGGDFELDNTEYQSAADNTSLSVTGSLTLAAWIKPETVTAGSYNILAKWDGATESYRLFQNGDEIRLEIDSSGNYQETTAYNLSAGTLYHVVGVYNAPSASIKIYINGSEAPSSTTGTIPSSITDDTGKFHIGAEDSTGGATGYYDGIIDEARIYNRVLSNREVSQLYNFGTGSVGYWKLDEKVGNNAYDSSSNDNTLTWTNTPTSIRGKFGSAINLAGSDQQLTRADDADFDFADDADFSFEAWIKHNTASAQQVIMSKFNEAGYKMIMEDDGDITCGLDYDSAWTPTDSITSTAATYDDNNWHHIACVKTGASTLSLYIDGVLIGTDSSLTASNAVANSDPLYIGIDADGTSLDFVGQIDEPKIYNYARTAGQVVEDMNAGHPAPGSPVGTPVGYWKFDEGYSITAYNSGNGSSMNGTLLTFASPATSASGWSQSGKFSKALIFDGSDDTVQVTRSTALEPAELSLSGWIKLDNFTKMATVITKQYDGTAGTGAGGGNTSYGLHVLTNGKVRFGLKNSGGFTDVDSPTALSTDTWYHLAGTFTGTTMKLYVNGQEVNSGSFTGPIVYNTGAGYDVELGKYLRSDTGFGLDGTLDEVKIYNFALTADQVKLDMNRGSTQVLGALGDNSTYQPNAANQEYCVPGDSTSCVAPVGRWDLEEKVGNTSFDTSTLGNDLTWTNTPTSTRGKVGTGINLAGSNQHLIRADDADFDFAAAGSFTLEAYFKHTASPSTQEEIMSKFATQGYKLLMETDGDITCTITDDAAQTDSATSTLATYDDDKWHHAACVKNASTSLTLYIDGVQVNQDATIGATSTLANTDPLYVGIDEDATSEDWVGQIDQVRIFNYARSASQVAWDYNRGGPVGYWDLDECQGTTAYDRSGNSLNGTITIGAGGEDTVGTCTTSSTAWGSGATGKRNYSLSFDGVDDYITIPDSAALDVETVSVSAWIKTSTNNVAMAIIEKWNHTFTPDRYPYSLRTTLTGLAAFRAHDGTNTPLAQSITTVADGTWHHIVGTRVDGGNLKIYVDGRLEATSTDTSTGDTTNDLAIGIGGRPTTPTNPYTGQIDDVKIFNYELTATQVKLLYTGGALNFGPTTGAP